MSRDDKELRPALAGAAADADVVDATPDDEEYRQRRRSIIQAGVGVGVVLTVGSLSALSVSTSLRPAPRITPEREPPADGDQLVLAGGSGDALSLADLTTIGGANLAYPRDPVSNVIKSGTVNNLILLTRLDPSTLTDATRPHAADGVVAYSAICPHLGCTVTAWEEDRDWFHCLCHHAFFNARNAAEVMTGISPRPLPTLPLKIVDGNLLIAGGFLGPVGVL